MAKKTMLEQARKAYNKNQQTKGGQKQAKKDRVKTKKKKEKAVGSSWDSVREKTQSVGSKGEENRKSSLSQGKSGIAKASGIAKDNKERSKSKSGAITPVKPTTGAGNAHRGSTSKNVTRKADERRKGVAESKRAREVAGDVIRYAGKDLVATGSTFLANGGKNKAEETDYKAFGESLKNAAKGKKTGTYTPVKTASKDSQVNQRTGTWETKKGWKKMSKFAGKATESALKELEDATKNISDKKEYDVPELGVINKIAGVESTKKQKKKARAEIDKTLKDAGLTVQDAVKGAIEYDKWGKEQGFEDDTLLTNGKTWAEQKKLVGKEMLKEVYGARTKAYEGFSGVGKMSKKDLTQMGIQGGVAMAEMLIPYIGTAGKALKAVDAVSTGGKALTAVEGGTRVLTKAGETAVKNAVKGAGGNTLKGLGDAAKQIAKSDLKTNVKREILANALQDATIGTTIDYMSAQKEGLTGKDAWKYLGKGALLNAALGAPIAGIAGRTGRAGKIAINEGITDSANAAITLSKAEGIELGNLIKKADNGIIMGKEQERLLELQQKAFGSEHYVVNSKGKIVQNNADTTIEALSREDAKKYLNLQAKQASGTLRPDEIGQFVQLQRKVQKAYKQTETVSEKIINLKTLKSGDLQDAETAVRFYERTGDEAKLKVAQKALEAAQVATKNLNESLDKAMKIMTDKTGIEYKWVTGDEMRAMGASEDSIVKGFTDFDKNGKATVYINRESPQAWQAVVGHETMHLIKKSNPQAYKELADSLEKYVKEIGEYDELEAVMRRNYPELQGNDPKNMADFREEMVSEMLGRYVFGEDDKFIKRLAGENPTALEKMVDYIKNLVREIKNPELTDQFNNFLKSAEDAIGAINKDEVAKNAKGAEGKAAKTYTPRSVDELTPKEYNNYGWAKANGVLSDEELGMYMKHISDVKLGKNVPWIDIPNGKMIAVGKNLNTLIITDAKWDNPSIVKVVKINSENGNIIEDVTDEITNLERNRVDTTDKTIQEYFDNIFTYQHKDDFPNYREFTASRERAKSKGNQRGNSELKDRGRGNENSESVKKYSKEKPANAGSFNAFDEKIPSTDAIKSGDSEYMGFKIKYTADGKAEAKNQGDHIEVSDKFLALDEEGRKEVLAHEVAHNVAEQIEKQYGFGELLDMEIFGKKKVAPEGSPRAGEPYYDGIFGDVTPNSLDESITDSVKYYITNPDYLKKRSQEAFDFIDKHYKEHGFKTDIPSLKSGKASKEVAHRDELLSDAEESYGAKYTEDFNETGFIFPDGKLPKMGDYGQRAEDHNVVISLYDDIGYDTHQAPKSAAMGRFLDEGNIRIMPENGSIEMSAKVQPTSEQYSAIRRFLNEHDEAEIEFSGVDGRSVDSKSYSNGVNADQVINDIKRFYSDGKIGGSDLNNFRYSKENIGYHAGDLGKAESMGNQTGGRGTGHFGTGTYFVGNKAKISDGSYGKRPVETVNFDKYNLYKPYNTKEAYELHDFLRDVNGYFDLVDSPKSERNFVANIKRRTDDIDYKLWDAEDDLKNLESSVKSMDDDGLLAVDIAEQKVKKLREEVYNIGKDALGESEVEKLIKGEDPSDLSHESANEILWKLQHPDEDGWYNNWERNLDNISSFYNSLDLWAMRLRTSKDKLLESLRRAKKQSDEMPWGSKERMTADSASTILMKDLGYEGVDVRHTDLDNTSYGSVIYDLKGEDLARKKEIGTAKYSKEAKPENPLTVKSVISDFTKDSRFVGDKKAFGDEVRELAELMRKDGLTTDVEAKVDDIIAKHIKINEYEEWGEGIDPNVKSLIKSSAINISELGDGTIAHKLENIGLSKADVPSWVQLRSAKGGRSLDSVYHELSDERPDLFPPDASHEDKLLKIIEASKQEPEVSLKPQEWIDGEKNDLKYELITKVADADYAEMKALEAKAKPKEEPKPEKPKTTKKPAKPKEPEKTEVQKLHENDYVSDNVKTALKDIEDAGDKINVGKAEKIAKRFNDLDKKIGAKTKHIENAKKSEKYATEAERAERVAELEDELATLKRRQAKAAGELEQLGEMKAVDPNKTAEQQIKEMRGERKVNKERESTDNLTKTDNWIKDKMLSVRRLWEDSLIDVEKTAKASGDMELLTAANRVRNSHGVANNWITNVRSKFDNTVGGKSLDSIFNKELIENEPKYADFQEYLIMKHVPARHAKGTDIYPEVSPALAEKRVAELEEKYGKELTDWADDVYDYIKDLQQYRVDSGMLSKEAAEQFEKDYPFYVPTNRVNDESGEIDFFTGGISNGIRSAKGGDNDVLDIYSQLYTATNKTIHAAEENQMLNLYFKAKGVTEEQLKNATLDDLEHAVIEAKVNKRTGASSVSFFVDGKPVRLPCNHQLALGLRELDGLEFERLLKAAKVATLYGKPFKALVTDWNLVFGVRNGARDLQQALVNSKDTRFFASSTGAAAHAVANADSPFRKLYASMGGERAQLVSYDAVARQMGIEKQGRVDAIHEKVQDFVDFQVKGKHVNPIHYVEGINGAIEMMPRMCEFIGTLRKEADTILKGQGSSLKQLRKDIVKEVNELEKAGKIGATNVSAEVENRLANKIIDMVGKDTIDTAMRNANDITLNFGRSGVLGKALNMGFVPYLNPSIQGLSKLVRLFSEAGQEGGWKALASIGMKLGTFTIAPAMLNELLLKDNEDYQNLNTRDKDNNFFIPLDVFGEEWEGKFFKFPKPRENAVLAEPAEYGLRYFLDQTEYAYFDWDKLKMEGVPLWEKIPLSDEGKQSIRTAIDNIGVINPATSNMLSPLYQTFHNKTWYGGTIESAYETSINEDTGKANVPVNKRYDTGTSGIAIKLGQTKVAKELNLSPKKIDNILDSYTGMIYDLGISQTTEEAKTRGNWFTRTVASQFVKDSVFSNKLSTNAWGKMDGMTKKEQDAYKSTYMYDTFKYDDAMDLITGDKNLTNKQKMDAKRALQIKKNKLNREAIDGKPNTSNPLVDIAEHLGATKTLNNFLPEQKDKNGKPSDEDWESYFKTYKNAKGYSGLNKAQKEKQSQKFLDVYTLGVQGQLTQDPTKFHDAPSWGMTGVAAAQLTKQGKLKGKDADLIMKTCGVYESQTEVYHNYAEHGGNVKRYAITEKRVGKTLDKVGDWGMDTKSGLWQGTYDKSMGAKGGTIAMSLATSKKVDFKDRAYYIANSSDPQMMEKMNAARGFSEKYGHKTKEISKLALQADALGDSNTYLKNDEIINVCNQMKGNNEEKSMAYVLLGGKPGKNPFGAIGNYAHDGDTGIQSLEDDGSGGGHGRRRRRGRRGHGGGGGGSKKGTMPKTESGAIKGKVSNPFSSSNGSKDSNLNDAYRRKVRKLRKQII